MCSLRPVAPKNTRMTNLQLQPSLWMCVSTVYWTSPPVGLNQQLTLITSKIHSWSSPLASSTTVFLPSLVHPRIQVDHLYSFSGSNFTHLSPSHIQCRGQTTLAPSPKSILSAHMLWRSVTRLFVTSWTGMSSWWEYWSGLPFPPPGELANLGIEPTSPASLHCRQIFTAKPSSLWGSLTEIRPESDHISALLLSHFRPSPHFPDPFPCFYSCPLTTYSSNCK